MRQGATVVGFDNLSRPGSIENLGWLKTQPGTFEFVHADVRNSQDVLALFSRHEDAAAVLHLAAQVAVTTSVVHPRHDLEVNVGGTFNLLEATRRFCPHAAFVYASTNKVYGARESATIVEDSQRYRCPSELAGVDEDSRLDLHSPYGCSKGAADQYVHDYHRIFGLKSVVLRQSCIYGTRQFGVEDQGWIAWFTIAATTGRPLTIYGDGKQVRDLLWVDDLVALYSRVIERIDISAGQIYNVGGGPANTLSILELIELLNNETGRQICPTFAPWRPGDQRLFIACISKAEQQLGWRPLVSPQQGVSRLAAWVREERELVDRTLNGLIHTPIPPILQVAHYPTIPTRQGEELHAS